MREAVDATVLPRKWETGDIIFQYCAAAYRRFTDPAAEGGAMLIKVRIAAQEEIRVGDIGIKTGFDTGDDILLVPLQARKIGAVPTVVKALRAAGIVIFIVVGAENQIFNAILLFQFHQFLHVAGKVFGLQPQVELDLPLVFFPQTPDALAVFRQVHRRHTNMGIVVGREMRPWRMVGKAEDLNPGGNGGFHITFIVAHCVLAAVGMGMVIGFHFIMGSSFLVDFGVTWDRGLRSAALAICSLLTWV